MTKSNSGPVEYKRPEIINVPPESVRIGSRCRGLAAKYWEWVEKGRPTVKPATRSA